MPITFDDDRRKAVTNRKKHGVSFREAMTVFDDPLAESYPDAFHSEAEDRFITIGVSSSKRLLFVYHLADGNHIRMIGAREATPRERKAYEDFGS